MKDQTQRTFFGIPWLLCALLACVVAILYWYVWPSDLDAQGFGRSILRYAHSVVWLLLAASAGLYSPQKKDLQLPAQLLAKASLGVYVIFLVTFLYYKL